jgi:hypothetical protein
MHTGEGSCDPTACSPAPRSNTPPRWRRADSSHTTGTSPVGYIRAHNVWIIGENLHWSTVEQSTPADTVRAWMVSPEHRKYLLKPRFRDLGVRVPRLMTRFRGPSGGRGRRFRTLGGVLVPRTERAWPPNPRGYTLASPSPDRTGGQITDRQPGADRDWAPGQSASPDPDPIRLNREPIQRPQRKTNRTA